jgi:hypothetical protein
MSSKKTMKKVNSTDSVGDVKETKNPTAEKCNKRSSYNPDDKDKYQEMISAAVELQLLIWVDYIKKVTTTHNFDIVVDEFLLDIEPSKDWLRKICKSRFRGYCERQDEENEDWYDLPLSKKVAHFVQEESNWLINFLMQLSIEDN